MSVFSYYDSEGKMRFTSSRDDAQRERAITLALSSSYGYHPDRVGKLLEILGRTDIPQSADEAQRIFERIAAQVGLPIEAVATYERIPSGWRVKLTERTVGGA